MKRIRVVVMLLMVLVSGIGIADSADAASKAEMIKSADALDAAFLAAFNSGDSKAMNALYWNSPEAVSFTPDFMVLRGIDEIKKANAHMSENWAGAKLTMKESHQIPVGEVVLGWGLWSIKIPGPGGTYMELEGRYSDAKAERDGKWVYLMDHASMVSTPEVDEDEAEGENGEEDDD